MPIIWPKTVYRLNEKASDILGEVCHTAFVTAILRSSMVVTSLSFDVYTVDHFLPISFFLSNMVFIKFTLNNFKTPGTGPVHARELQSLRLDLSSIGECIFTMASSDPRLFHASLNMPSPSNIWLSAPQKGV